MAVLEILVAALLLAVIVITVKYVYLRANFERKVKDWIEREEERIRRDAIGRSARTLSGKTLEKLIPFLDKFPYDSHDMRWLGDPIDFVIFDGHSSQSPKQIVFCEVKSGSSRLSKTQSNIRELIDKKKVKWFEFRI